MTRRCILTIEDDPAIRRGIVDALEYAGYNVLQAGDGIDGAHLAIHRQYDLLLLDLVLPGKSRSGDSATGPGDPSHVAGDHPHRARRRTGSRGRLAARGRRLRREAVQRQGTSGAGGGGVAADARTTGGYRTRGGAWRLCGPGACEVRFDDGERVELSEKEIELLRYLVRHSGRAISRDELLGNVWRISPQGVSTRTIDMHIARLREKLRDDPAPPRTLLTVRGKGYMFAAPVRVRASWVSVTGIGRIGNEPQIGGE